MMLIFQKKMRTSGGRGYEISDTCGQGGRGAKIGGRPLWMAPNYYVSVTKCQEERLTDIYQRYFFLGLLRSIEFF